MPTISKSRFVSGVQCEKKLYFDIFRKDLKPPLNEEQLRLFSSGNEVGVLAQQVFPNGKDATFEMNGNWSVALGKTKEWLQGESKTIYEATFSHSKVFAALDIMHRHENELWAIEVKSSTEVKDYHITDASFQYWVMKKCDVNPDRFFIMHINNGYVKKGKINPKELFTLTDITEQVKDKQNWVTEELKKLHLILEAQTEPIKSIGEQCHSPFSCDYKHHCWSHVPKNSVFELYNPRGKDWELYNKGILKLEDIPDSAPLNHRQKLQIDGVKTGASFIDQKAISEFLNKVDYPLYFFDFETIFPAIPLLNDTRPFQQTPFQYSLHILNTADGELVHRDFLANPADFKDTSVTDPRRLLLEQLKTTIGPSGSIMAYNATFEISVLKSLIPIFPEFHKFIYDLCSRFVDLLIPFKNAWYYTPEMAKSASIKSVLPALAPEFSYADLPIGNGGEASETFLAIVNGSFDGNIEETRQHLLRYCERDTYGMVVLWKVLNEKTCP
ncbi:MAG: DUF2779 domain-containing protein [Bacteroidota bacterium]